jgi:hypothetical protein
MSAAKDGDTIENEIASAMATAIARRPLEESDSNITGFTNSHRHPMKDATRLPCAVRFRDSEVL